MNSELKIILYTLIFAAIVIAVIQVLKESPKGKVERIKTEAMAVV